MSDNKKKTPLIALTTVALVLAAGAVTYFTKSSSSDGSATQEVVAAEVSTAAGNPSEAPKVEGINVEAGNPVVAKVDGKDITRSDVYRFIQTMPANVQQMPAVQIYPMAMEQVINTRIVQTQAEQAKIEDTPEFKVELDIAKQQIARNLYLQTQVDAKISEKDIKKAYNVYAKKVPDVEERRASHILVETEEKAKAVLDKLNNGGVFAELAKSLSTGPTGPKGGDLGYFAKEEMVPEFAKAAFAGTKGTTVSTPVKTQFGWHVLQVVDVRQRPKPTLEQMTPTLRADLNRTTLETLLKDWRDGAKVEQFDINGKPLKKGANAIGLVPAEADAKTDG